MHRELLHYPIMELIDLEDSKMKNLSKIMMLMISLIFLATLSGTYATNQGHDGIKHVITQHSSASLNKTVQFKTIYVNIKGNDKNNGLIPAMALKTIQKAINIAKSGDTIKVANGTYKENLRINKDIIIIGNNCKNTVIDGCNKNSTVHVGLGAEAFISGFTITHGKSQFGGGINNEGSLNLKNVLITGNTAFNGGGILNDGDLEVLSSVIRDNHAEDGGGISNEGHATIVMSTIAGNIGDNAGGGFNNVATLYIVKSIVRSNHADIGGGICSAGEVQVFESNITSNHARLGGGIHNDNGRLSTLSTNINKNTAQEGAGLYNYMGIIQFFDTKIILNTGVTGGGISNYGLINLYNVQITANKAYVKSGGIYNYATIYWDKYCNVFKNSPENVNGNPVKNFPSDLN
jgi:hypothetical protein